MILRTIVYTLCFCQLTVLAIGQSTHKTADSNAVFAFELFKEVFKKDSNVLLSPYSISSALAMTYAGARNETEKQMSRVLHYDLNQLNTHEGFSMINSSFTSYKTDPVIKLSIANALWKDENWGFKKDYLELTKKYYSASIFPLKGARPINDWADKNTNGKIKEIVEEKDLINARLVLTNAIYFKGDWLTSFNQKETKKDKFRTTENKMMDVDMMFQTNEVNYFEDDQNQVIELPYKGETMTMTFLLPKESNSILNLSTNINNKLLDYYNSNLSKQKVKLYIPKFSFTSEFHLEEVLPKMGMPDAFHPIKADFTGMSDGLSISKVIHKAFIEVNEKGSEAAAVTAVVMRKSSVAPKEIIFKANRPFILLIIEKQTGSILFIGSVLNPNQL